MRKLLSAGALALAVLTGSDWAGPLIPDETRERYAKACATYENRARFLPRSETVDFVVMMAEGCRAAQATLASGGPGRRAAAVAYLGRLVELRDTVIAMNTDRAYGPGAGPRSWPIERSAGELRAFGGVSRTGELLIAQRMGLLAMFDRWRAGAPDFRLALGH